MLSGLHVRDGVHLVDLAVALHAADAAVHVDRVVEIDVIGHLVDLHPRHGLARLVAVPHHGASSGLVVLDLVVAVHAGLRGRAGWRSRTVSTLLWQ